MVVLLEVANKSTARPDFAPAMLAVPLVRLRFSGRTRAARYDFFATWLIWIAMKRRQGAVRGNPLAPLRCHPPDGAPGASRARVGRGLDLAHQIQGGLEGFVAFLPLGGAHLARVGGHVLGGLHLAQQFGGVAADAQVVDLGS